MFRKLLMMLIIVLGIGSLNGYGASTPAVYINDIKVLTKSYLGDAFINEQGSLYVPLEGVMQYYGTEVFDIKDSKGLRFTKGANEMTFFPQETYYNRNGFKIPLEGELILKDDVLYVPIRGLMESLGHRVTWDADAFAVRIHSSEERIEEIRQVLDAEGEVSFSAAVEDGKIVFEWPETTNVDYFMLYVLSDDWKPVRAARIIFPKSSTYYRPGFFDISSLEETTTVYFKASAVIEGVESQLSEPIEVFLEKE